MRRVIRVAGWMLLVAIGAYAGGCVPFWCLFLTRQGPGEAVLSGAIILAVIAVGAALICPRHYRSWVVPLVCGILIGEIILLAQAAWGGWKLDMDL
jgi:hypothetical protein